MWPFKSKPGQPKDKIAKPIKKLRTYEVGRGLIKITSADGVIELRDIKGCVVAHNWDYYANEAANNGICYKIPSVTYAEVTTLQDAFNNIVNSYTFPGSTHILCPDDNTRVLHQVVRSVELLNVQDLSVDVEVTVGYELVDVPISDTVD